MRTQNESAKAPEDLLNDLLGELRSLVVDAEKVIGGSAAEHSEAAVGALRARFAAAQERFAALYTNTRQKVVAGVKCTDEAIRENPYKALGIALGAGLLAGVLLGRRDK